MKEKDFDELSDIVLREHETLIKCDILSYDEILDTLGLRTLQ